MNILPDSESWYYVDEVGNAVGPVSFGDLQKSAALGKVSAQTLIARQGDADWRPYSSLVPPQVPVTAAKAQITDSRPRRWPAVLSTLLCFPLGLIGLWLNRGYTTKQKSILTITSVLIFVVGIVLGYPGFIVLVFALNGAFFISWNEAVKPIWKTLGILALTILLVPMAFLRPETSETNLAVSDESTTTSTLEKPPERESASKPPSERQYQLQEDFTLGVFSYRVFNRRKTSELGNRFASAKASPGAIFLIVSYQIRNESNQTKTVLSDDFILRDSKGREFQPSSQALTALAMSGDTQDLMVRQLQPGITKRTLTAFEVPYESLNKELVLVIPEKGFGRGKAVVNLAAPVGL